MTHSISHSRLKTQQLFSKFLFLSLSRTELTDHRPSDRVLEVFGDVNFAISEVD